MSRRIESLFLTGPAGKLEAILEEPEVGEPVEAALVCHPHPQHGGTMHNKVVYRLARGLRKTGCVVLRFNFRGVNLSEGEYGRGIGETEDARTALEELRRRYPDLPALVGGFSFGSRVALKLAASDGVLTRVIAAGFPTKYPNHDFVYKVGIPKFFVQSTNDEFGPKPQVQEFFDSLPQPKQLTWVEAENHFFRNGLDEYEREISRIGNLRGSAAPRIA
jgi:alpha/beta superfamily hydrolase